jgi:hypothetical protein
MNNATLLDADRGTHVKIVPIALVTSTTVFLVLLYHKFHLWLLRMRRTQCGHL